MQIAHNISTMGLSFSPIANIKFPSKYIICQFEDLNSHFTELQWNKYTHIEHALLGGVQI